MIDLSNIKHIYLYPCKTDFRNGLYGLRKIIGDTEPNSIYVFANKGLTQLKIIEVEENAIWLYQKKLLRGKYIYTKEGDITLLNKEEIKLIIEGISLINKIETKGEKITRNFY